MVVMVHTDGRDRIQVTIHPAKKEAPLRDTENYLLKEEHYALRKAEKSLNALIGVNKVKEFVKEMYALVYVNQCREKLQLEATQHNLHMMFIGNPGTGKTTVARIMAQMLKDMNILEKGHLIEAERADLVGEYIGQTAQKTRDLIKKANGGVLFIDEAYSLARGGEKDFGREAVDALVKAMEDHQHKFILILAGYPEEMKRFLRMNPGLPSRFPNILQFEDFTSTQLVKLFKQMAKEKDYQCTEQLGDKLIAHFQDRTKGNGKNYNGRYVRNLIEKMIRRHALRILKEGRTIDKHSLITLETVDFIIEDEEEFK
ncbi:AAA family ATPase [Bacillus piscicola]|uniref:AAA family ATPase n=1 Tax=Bacillus piscicola TaxID=1632684 RepID=UPI001F092C8F|nr:AAA family ATPase [Bacillus piscicola]